MNAYTIAGMTQSEQIKALEKKIAEGLKPRCPLCGSALKIEDQQKGATGAKAYNYTCTKENDPACPLRPGTAYAPWHRVISDALKSKIVQFALLIIGSVSLTLGAGHSFGLLKIAGDPEAKDQQETTPPDRNDDEQLAARLSVLQQENGTLKSTIDRYRDSLRNIVLSDDQRRLITYGKIWRGFEYPKETRSIADLFGALADLDANPGIPISFESRNEILERLAGFISQGQITEAERLQQYIDYTNRYALAVRKQQNLGLAYFHLADQGEPAQLMSRKLRSMAHFFQYLRDLSVRNPNLLANEKRVVWPTIRDIHAFAQGRNKLPAAWTGVPLSSLETALDAADAATLDATIRQLEEHLRNLE